jgi:riboflavin kinase/FMN adenylyltransferase
MKVHRDCVAFRPIQGMRRRHRNFDGCIAVIAAVVEEARHGKGRWPPGLPRSPSIRTRRMVGPGDGTQPDAAAPQDDRASAELGLDHLFLLRFDATLMAMPAQAFIDEVLVDRLAIHALAAGDGFRFGHKRQGDVALLAEAGIAGGFGFEAVPPLLDGEEACSSTRIRDALDLGDLETANRLLGYPFTATGIVVRGDQRGRTIGFPTANIVPNAERLALPATGVYAVRAGRRTRGGTAWHPGVANLGRRPTFDGDRLLLEVHPLRFPGRPLRARLDVAFIERLRGEAKFSGIDALPRQIAQDCLEARRVHGPVLS